MGDTYCYTRTVKVWNKTEWVPVEVDVVIDREALAAHLGRLATRNNSRKSEVQGGIIVATTRPK